MKRLLTACLVICAASWSAAALAQTTAGSLGGGLPTPPVRAHVPDLAPPAVPGAGNGSTISTSLPIPKTETGDPTVELFTAVNSGDYNAAQDAVSRGADMNAQNAFGETPLDLSIALNRSPITFMLLSARNEGGGGGAPPGAAAITPPAPPIHRNRKFRAIPARMETLPPVAVAPAEPGDDPGTPNPSAGFLGFGQSR